MTDLATSMTQTSLTQNTPRLLREKPKEVRFSPNVQYLGENNDDCDSLGKLELEPIVNEP